MKFAIKTIKSLVVKCNLKLMNYLNGKSNK